MDPQYNNNMIIKNEKKNILEDLGFLWVVMCFWLGHCFLANGGLVIN
jgi:hypothetical protein